MKILSIRIKNLASLSGEHFIDFESEPLASAGLVAIVGQTGAGKSTILDAMCLALFNQIPRLKQSDGKLQDVDGSDLLVNSPLTVLRRGTAHGFAELCFIAQDQKHYLARWELKRSREKVDGKLQSIQRYLKCLTDGVVVADKAKAVDANIHKITQLTFEQFTRAVLLAQSEVTAFLKARDNERGELLEYLTNSNIFGKIGELAFRKTAEITKKRKQLEEFLGHIDVLSEADIAELIQNFKITDTEYKSLENEKMILEQQYQWFQRKKKLDQEIIIKQQLLNYQEKNQHDLIPIRKHLNRLEIFSSIRPIVLQQQQQLKIQQQLEPQMTQLQNTFDGVEKQFVIEKSRYHTAETALNTLQAFEQQHSESLKKIRYCIQERDFIGEEYKKNKKLFTHLEQQQQPVLNQLRIIEQQTQQVTQKQLNLNQQLQETQSFSQLDKGLNAHIQQLAYFIEQYSKIENQLCITDHSNHLSQVQTQLAEQKLQLSQLTQQFDTIDKIELQLIEKQKNREILQIRLNQIDLIQQGLKQYFELQQEYSEFTQKLESSNVQFEQSEKETLQSAQDFELAKNDRVSIQKVLQQQQLLHTENVESLRANLIDHQPCSVCGSREHPYRNDNTMVSKALFELQQQQLIQAENREHDLFQKWQIAQNDSTKLQSDLEQNKVRIEQLSIKVKNHQQDLIQQCKVLDLNLNLKQSQEQNQNVMAQYILNLKHEIQRIDTDIQDRKQAIKSQQLLEQWILKTEHQVTTAQQLQQQVQHIVCCLSELEQQNWHQQSYQSAQNIQVRLKNRLTHLEQLDTLNSQLLEYQQQTKTLQSKQENIAQQIVDMQKTLDDILAKGQENTEIASQLILKMTGLSEIKPNDWIIQHDHERQQKQIDYQNLKNIYEQVRLDFEKCRNELAQLKTQSHQNIKATEHATQEIMAWLKLHPDFDTQVLNDFSHIQLTEQQQQRTQLEQADRSLNEAASALKTMQEQLTQHSIDQPNIQQEQLIGSIQMNLANLNTQLEIRDQLKLKIELHQQNIEKQKQFSNQIQEIQLEEHRWGKISSLIGDSKGKEFRDYAQQYNLDILIEHSNQQLTMLSQRYTLKRLENSLSLAIIDHDMDGETRSVASLSGGESFLTALALSLAIANMASGSMKIESLFIDEGFGTLDATSLHMVMNALDQLQNQGRKVVLISHIQEMHERIPVQIQVRPLGAGASTIKIVS